MPQHRVTHNPASQKATRMGIMRVGDIAQLLDGTDAGKLVIRTYSNWTLLADPSETWSDCPDYRVDLLPRGTEVTIRIGG